jgi:hypothetical protein
VLDRFLKSHAGGNGSSISFDGSLRILDVEVGEPDAPGAPSYVPKTSALR